MTGPVTGPATVPIDPLSPARAGVYRDDLVEVRAVLAGRARRGLHTVRTPHFDLTSAGAVVHVDHVLGAAEIDDDLAGLLADELFAPGWLRGAELFERIFTGVVVSTAADPLEAWEHFYRNTLRRVEAAVARAAAPHVLDAAVRTTGFHDTIEGYAPVYAHAEALLAGTRVVDLGCCFGFLALRLARAGWVVTASDVSSGTVRLLGQVATRLGVEIATVVADAARYPGADRCADTVLVLHLLEHLEPEHGDRVVAEALRVARRRVVVAVPFETEPEETWGHVRTVTVDDLERWGRRAIAGAGVAAYEVHEHHGGWLILDR